VRKEISNNIFYRYSFVGENGGVDLLGEILLP